MSNKFKALEDYLRELYKGRKYGHKDAFEYHLVGVAELAREKAREANLDPDLAYALGLIHDVAEDFGLHGDEHQKCGELLYDIFQEESYIILGATYEITNQGKTYYDYIKQIRVPYALLAKEADLEFNLLQDNAPRLRKYDLYRFALDTIKMKRIVVG